MASIVLSPSSARTNEEMTASRTCRGSATLTAWSWGAARPSRHVHTANSRKAIAAANAIGRSGSVSSRKWPIATDSPCTKNDAMPTPDSTTHHRAFRVTNQIVRKPLCRKQHGQDSGVGMADRVDTDPAHHRRHRSVGLRLYPCGSMLKAEVG